MDLTRLKAMEAAFLEEYPGGFADPGMEAILKRHRKGKAEAEAQERFGSGGFANAPAVCDAFARFIGRSTVVSLFEKPKLREAVADFGPGEQAAFADALRERLHGDGQAGFEAMVRILGARKLAKWSLVSALPAYFSPRAEVFVKPSVAKAVVEAFGLPLRYRPAPDWGFYAGYREAVLEMAGAVAPSLFPSTLAFSGFLMMGLKA